MWYQHKGADFLEFHLHGLREDGTAISRAPGDLHEKTRGNPFMRCGSAHTCRYKAPEFIP